MVPGEPGSVASQGCRLQRLGEFKFSLRTSRQCSVCKQPPFYRDCFCLGLSHVPPPFFLCEHFLGSQRVFLWRHWERVSVTQHASNMPGVKINTSRALGKVMLSSGDKSMGSVWVTTSQEKSRSDMQIRNKLPEGTIQINLSDLGH